MVRRDGGRYAVAVSLIHHRETSTRVLGPTRPVVVRCIAVSALLASFLALTDVMTREQGTVAVTSLPSAAVPSVVHLAVVLE
jgi:hypothetical protein